MKRWIWGSLSLVVALGLVACESDTVIVGGGGNGNPPAAPRNLNAWYYDRAVNVTWELAPAWDGESFRVYAKRTSDANHFLIAEVTNCSGGLCSYVDVNIAAGNTYNYYVSAVNVDTGAETASDFSIDVDVPQPVPPPVPDAPEAMGLDGAIYLRWGAAATTADDFSFYRVYLSDGDDVFLLGETDSQGFLDERTLNGSTYTYFLTSVDTQGHESAGSVVASGTPRPDYHGEWVYAYSDVPGSSGFRFTDDESVIPVVDGDSPTRHFRLEVDVDGWWLVPGPEGEVHPTGVATTALKCGPGADADCAHMDVAPSSGYTTGAVGLTPQTTYAMRVVGDDGAIHYGAVRADLLGYDQDGSAIMIFDWAYQLQAGNRSLMPGNGVAPGDVQVSR